jgi:hypothetical protein
MGSDATPEAMAGRIIYGNRHMTVGGLTGYFLRRRVPRLDSRPPLDVNDLRQATDALGEVQASPSVVEYCRSRGGVRPRVGDRQLFSIC